MMEFVPAEERTIGDRVVLSVNAMDLYAFLGIRNPFMTWWPDQVRRANLLEGKDFSILMLQGSGRNRTDVFLTTDAAEEIALQSDDIWALVRSNQLIIERTRRIIERNQQIIASQLRAKERA